jgi:outer membrane protein TolC
MSIIGMFPLAKRLVRSRRWTGLWLLLGLTGCTANYYRQSADRSAYGAIQAKSPLVPNMDRHFSIAQTNTLSLAGLPLAEDVPDFLGPEGQRDVGAHIVNLETALNLAVQHSRSYQSRKEQLYLSGLALTLVRHQFTPLFTSEANVTYAVQRDSLDAIAGVPGVNDEYAEQAKVTAGGTIGASWLIRDVGRITTAFTADAIRFVTGDPRLTTSSQLSATFFRPLLRDAGFKTQIEVLIQAERQLLYDLRDFTRYRKDFSVQIATAYYGVLGLRDLAKNNYLTLESSRKNAERTRALAQEGRVTTADLGRLEQQELSAESTWISAVRGYQQALDSFKIQLGLSVDTQIVLDEDDLRALQIRHPEISVNDSIEVALTARLDYQNTKDQFEDTVRKVEVAANLLKPRVDLTASISPYSNPNDNFSFPDLQRYRWDAGVVLDPGLDRQSERDAYRTALITRDRAGRAIVQQEDDIKLEVRNSWRTLDQAKRNYEISEIGVKLAERRVEEQNLLADLGRAKAQDQVDAQNSLNDSKNQRTQALVTHTIARLQFWNNMGILYIKDNGQWEEMQHAKAQ